MKYTLTFTFSSLLMLKILSTQFNEDLVIKLQEKSLTITFPEKGSLYNEDIKITFQKLKQQLKWKRIDVLELKNVTRGEIFQGVSFSTFPDLSRLAIENSRINYFPESTFEGLYFLFWLKLIDIKLKSLSANLFKSTSKLVVIRLSVNELEDLSAGVFSNLPEVTEISLDSNKLKTLPKGIFPRSLKQLTHLFLMDNLIIRLEENVFMTEKLRVLNLSLNAVSHVDKNTFKELSNLKEIIMTRTFTDKIQSLPKDIFPNSSKLETIKMNQNHFESLEVGIFHNLSRLGELDLSFNELTNLSDEIFKNNIHLRLLYLSNNKLSHLGKKIFGSLSELWELHLENNQLSYLDPDVFLKLRRLAIFNISNNKVDLAAAADLSVLNNSALISAVYAKNNNISRIFKDWRRNRWLRMLDLRFNPIPPSEINCDTDWRLLDLNLTTNEFIGGSIDVNKSMFNNLDTYCLESHRNTNWSHILDLDQRCHRTISGCSCIIFMDYKSKRTILNCTRFDEKELQEKLPNEVIRRSFETEFILSNCNLTSILPVSKYLRQSNNVTELVLSENKLTSLNDMPELPALKVLDLHKNNFTTLDQNATEMLNRSIHLTNVMLHQNPWNCNCDQEYFWNFIRDHESMISKMDEMRCSNGKQFVLYITAEACELDPYEISFIGGSIVVLAISCITCAALTYKYKMEIKIWMYHTSVFSPLVTEQSIDNTREYDAFVCFSRNEDEFVRNKLVPQLEESNPSFKLCIHIRDWNGGDHIPTRICSSVANSQCTIIVLSPSFLESFYCREELRVARNQSLEDKRHRVFLIPVEEIATDELDDELKGYINDCLYVPWKDNEWFWKKLRYLISHRL